MVAPITNTICNIAAEPCGTPGSAPSCPTSGATVATDSVFFMSALETEVPFDVDVNEYGGDDAESALNRIVVGHSDVYHLVFFANYGPSAAGNTATMRIKVNGITQITRPIALNLIATQQVEEANILLSDGDALTVTLQTSVPGEGGGVNVTQASLQATRVCGSATDVIIPQG